MKVIRLWLAMALLALGFGPRVQGGGVTAQGLKPKEEPRPSVLRVGERLTREMYEEARAGGYEGGPARFARELRGRGELRRTARGVTFTPHDLGA